MIVGLALVPSCCCRTHPAPRLAGLCGGKVQNGFEVQVGVCLVQKGQEGNSEQKNQCVQRARQG